MVVAVCEAVLLLTTVPLKEPDSWLPLSVVVLVSVDDVLLLLLRL